MWIYVAALFAFLKSWKQSKWSSAGKWLSNDVMEYYLAIKRMIQKVVHDILCKIKVQVGMILFWEMKPPGKLSVVCTTGDVQKLPLGKSVTANLEP